jgi:hypothetical protein
MPKSSDTVGLNLPLQIGYMSSSGKVNQKFQKLIQYFIGLPLPSCLHKPGNSAAILACCHRWVSTRDFLNSLGTGPLSQDLLVHQSAYKKDRDLPDFELHFRRLRLHVAVLNKSKRCYYLNFYLELEFRLILFRWSQFWFCTSQSVVEKEWIQIDRHAWQKLHNF